MDGKYGPYYRSGEPGGPGCRVSVIEIAIKAVDGAPAAAALLDAGEQSTEIELLRTVAQALGIRWGQDTLGWWAVVPKSIELQTSE